MDENTAWRNFVQSGSVSDYLTYCRIRLGCPPIGEQEDDAQQPEAHHENQYRGTGIDLTGRWR